MVEYPYAWKKAVVKGLPVFVSVPDAYEYSSDCFEDYLPCKKTKISTEAYKAWIKRYSE